MRVISSKSVDSDLVVVQFERATPEPARTPTVEVVFDVHFPSGLGATSVVLTHLSSTRTDTRQPEELSKEEFRLAYQAAAEHLAED